MRTLISDVCVLDKVEPVSVAIEGGRILAIGKGISGSADVELEGKGRLLLPGLVNPHVHVDKAFIGQGADDGEGSVREKALRYNRVAKRHYSPDDLAERVRRVIEEAIIKGTTAIRAFCDVDPIAGLRGIDVAISLRDEYASELLIQIVAHPQEAIYASPGTAALMELALAAGADVVGGVPGREETHQEERDHIDFCLDLAQRFDRDVHMMVDDTDGEDSRTLEYLALRTKQEGLEGRVVASHCGALAAYEHVYAERVIRSVKTAGIYICSNPHISLVLAGRNDRGFVRRGVTRVRELLNADIDVIAGQDDIDDPFYPFGCMDQLEIAQYMSHVAHLTSPGERRKCIEMVTGTAAKAMGLEGYGLSEGSWADLVVLDCRSLLDALRCIPPRRWVLFRGEIVSETLVRTQRHSRGDQDQ